MVHTKCTYDDADDDDDGRVVWCGINHQSRSSGGDTYIKKERKKIQKELLPQK